MDRKGIKTMAGVYAGVRLLSLLILMALSGGCIQDTPSGGRSLIGVGERLPEVTVTLSDGVSVSTRDMEGQPSLTVLFTTACGDCRRLLPVLEEFHRGYPSIPVLLIARSEGAGTLAHYWEENNLTMRYSPQEDDAVYRLFATGGVPRLYAADAGGTVVAEWDDSHLPGVDEIAAALEDRN